MQEPLGFCGKLAELNWLIPIAIAARGLASIRLEASRRFSSVKLRELAQRRRLEPGRKPFRGQAARHGRSGGLTSQFGIVGDGH